MNKDQFAYQRLKFEQTYPNPLDTRYNEHKDFYFYTGKALNPKLQEEIKIYNTRWFTWKSAVHNLYEIVEEQRLAIVALNIAIGGEGSLTTDNLVTNFRLREELDQLKSAMSNLERTVEILRWRSN